MVTNRRILVTIFLLSSGFLVLHFLNIHIVVNKLLLKTYAPRVNSKMIVTNFLKIRR